MRNPPRTLLLQNAMASGQGRRAPQPFQVAIAKVSAEQEENGEPMFRFMRVRGLGDSTKCRAEAYARNDDASVFEAAVGDEVCSCFSESGGVPPSLHACPA